MDAYADKPETYFGNPRRDYVAELPANPDAKIIELGCGDGSTGALALREGKCGTYIGVELFAPMADRARSALTAVHQGDIATVALPYAPETFDALICSEVLEHLVDPAAALAKLVPLLKPGARVFASCPNISHWRIILGLLWGRFDYADVGVMDRTHLRWFAPASMRRLFTEAGLTVTSIRPICRPQPHCLLLTPRFEHLVWDNIDVRAVVTSQVRA